MRSKPLLFPKTQKGYAKCRLALLNRQAVTSLSPYLDSFFEHLESTLGGHGNGVAGLWMEGGITRLRKGVNFSVAQAAYCAQKYVHQGADWVLFHTRRATSSEIQDHQCHPFRSGKLLLAHNGHDAHFAKLSKPLGISDSECMARTWARVHFPLSGLATRSGVFIGFAHDHPFVVKGQKYSDLIAAWEKATGSILFASELPLWMAQGVFDRVVEISTIQWFGRELDQKTLNVRPYVPRTAPPSRLSPRNPSSWIDDFDELSETEGRLSQEALYEEEDWELQRQVEHGGYRL